MRRADVEPVLMSIRRSGRVQSTAAEDGTGGRQTLLSGVMSTLGLSLKQMSQGLVFVSATFRWA